MSSTLFSIVTCVVCAAFCACDSPEESPKSPGDEQADEGSSAEETGADTGSTGSTGEGDDDDGNDCTDVGCDAGFALVATPAEATAIPDGTYTVSLEVEGTQYTATCIIPVATPAECDVDPVDGAHAIYVEPAGDGPSYFDIRVWQNMPTGSKGSKRGPTSIDVSVALDAEVIGAEEFAPTYVHDATFWGNESCGYCEYMDDGAEMSLALP